MTRAEAKRRAVELWGEMGVIGRATAVLALVGSFWLLVTAAYGVAGSLFVKRGDFEAYVHDRDATLARYLSSRDSAQAVRNLRDSVFQAQTRRNDYRECVRHHGERSCLLEKP